MSRLRNMRGGLARLAGASKGAPEPDGTPGAVRPAAAGDANSWGWLPALSLVGALGLLLVALAVSDARAAGQFASPLFWIGVLLLFVPLALRQGAAGLARHERIGLIAILGLGLYLVKVMHSPVVFTFHDEFVYWRTTNDVIRSGHLFNENPLLPVSSLYPGLAIVTTALADLSGLSIYSAGVVVLGVARLVLVVALFFLYEQVSHSSRGSAIASVLYMANPNFVFFDAEFSYESLALPLAVLGLLAAARRAQDDAGSRVGLTLVILLTLGALVVTHHLSSYAFASFLILWTLVAVLAVRTKRDQPGAGGVALLAVVASLAWLVYIATLTAGYLAPVIEGGVNELIRLIAGEITARQLFRDVAGQVPPLWEQLTAYASVGLILLGLPFGLFRVWRRYRANAAALALAAGALAYPPSQAFRLTQQGAETSNRVSEFLFVAIAFVLAIGVAEVWLSSGAGWTHLFAFACWAAVIFTGGVIVAWAPWSRLPGPYLVSADTRSIEPEGLAAADWARAILGPSNRIAADRTNRLLMGSYGEQRPVTGYTDGVDVPALYTSPQWGPIEQAILQSGAIHYVVVDRRLSSGLPMVGNYFEDGEEGAHQYSRPLNPVALTKFERLARVSRVFDSGDITIHDTGALAGGR